MDVNEAIRTRKSVRSYEQKPVPKNILLKVLEAARLSPSAVNFQPWHFIVVTDEMKRNELSKGRYAKFLAQTPVVIVGCGDTKKSQKWCTIDVTIALQQMVLQATEEGLGTCWIGSFDEDDVKKICRIPENFKVVCLLAMGYPKERFDIGSKLMGLRNRKKLDEIVSSNEFGVKFE